MGGFFEAAFGFPAVVFTLLLAPVLAVADLAQSLPPDAELDLNPITVLSAGKGVRILDAALAVADEED